MRTSVFLSTVAVLSALSLPALAEPEASGVLSVVQGKVLVNVGKGFVAASEGQSLKAGDRIMVGKDATASLWLKDANCTLALPAQHVTLLRKGMSCQAASLVPDGPVHIVPASSDGQPSGVIDPRLIAGGIFLIGTGAVILSTHMKDTPVSSP